MKKNYFCTAMLLLAGLFIPELNAQITIAHDVASSYDTATWIPNSNQPNSGFTNWIMFINGNDPNGVAGHFIGNSVEDGFGDVDTDDKAFGMYGYKIDAANGGYQEAVVFRYFNNTGAPSAYNGTPLLPGQSFSIDLAVARRNGYKGIDLLTSQGSFLWNFGMDGDLRYQVNQEDIFQNQYLQQSVFKIKAYQVTTNTFKVTITRGNEVWTSSATALYSGNIGGFKIYEGSTTSSSVLNRLYFNNLEITKCAEVTTWDGSLWSNGSPDINKTVVIAGNYTSAGNISACMLVVQNGASVSIAAGNTLTVANTIDVKTGGTLTIEHNAALLQLDENAENTGNITVKRNSNALYKLDYTLWGAPVQNQQLQAFSTATLNTRFYNYAYNWSATVTPAAYREQYYQTSATQNFAPGKGYLIRMPNSLAGNTGYNGSTATYVFPGAFTGKPTNGDIKIPILQSDLAPATTGQPLSQAGHYIAVANPYASPISVAAFFEENSEVLSAGDGIYFWRKTNDNEASSYAYLTKAAFADNAADGGNTGNNGDYYTTNDTLTFNPSWIISPGQGFLVKIADGAVATDSVTFTNAMRVPAPAGGQPFFKTANTQEQAAVSRLWLNLTGANNAFSQAAVVYMDGATTGLDYGFDGKIISGGNAKLYSLAAESSLAIQARPAFTVNDEVPLGLTVTAAGTYSISLEQVQGVFATGQNAYLIDNLAGTTVNLSEAPYSFSTDAGTFNTRFTVVYDASALGATAPQLANTVMVYPQNGVININSGTAEMSDIAVYDMRGRKLYAKNGINAGQATITGLNAANGVLIVQISTDKGMVSKKIIY